MVKLKWERERRKILGDRWWGEGETLSYRILHVPRTKSYRDEDNESIAMAAPAHYRISAYGDPRGWFPIDSRFTLQGAKRAAEEFDGRHQPK